MKYRLLFYKSKWGDWKWIDNFISLLTLAYNWFTPDAAHVEVWIEEAEGYGFASVDFNDTGTAPETVHYLGYMFTSTMRGDDNGTVMRPASKVLKHPKRWFYYEFECDEADFDIAMLWAGTACKNNQGYGKRTLLKFIGINWHDPFRNICSQIAHKWCVLCENMKPPPRIPSPRRLAKWCEKLGKERKYL